MKNGQIAWARGLLCLYADDSQHCCDSHLIHSYLLCAREEQEERRDESVSPHFLRKLYILPTVGFVFV